MLRLSGPRKVVIFAGEDHEFRIHAIMPQRAEPLLALLDRNAVVVVGMQNQRRRLDVLGVFERRRVPILIEIVKQETVEVVLMPISAVARSVVTDEIGNAA